MILSNLCKYSKILILSIACSVLFITDSMAVGKWKKLSNVPPSYNYGVMLLLTDGTVMVKTAGSGSGEDFYGYGWGLLTPDASGSYLNGTWSILSSMNYTRLYFSSQILRDGRVYVAGGEYGSGSYNSEIYDVLLDQWTNLPGLPKGDTILDANSEMLPDGRVLQSIVINPGGAWGTENFIYDPAANTYTAAPSSIGSHDESTWVKLQDNSILFVDFYRRTSERYIPATNTWVADATLPVPVYDTVIGETGPACLLPDGRCIFFGANGNTAYYTPSGSTSPGTWAAGPTTPYKRGTPDGGAAMMVNGKILISLSDTPSVTDNFPSPTYFYEFNYLTDSFTEIKAPIGIDTLSDPSFDTHMLNLPDGSILFSYGNANYYEYIPDSTPLPTGQPVVSSVIKAVCDTYMATGTLFNGISEGSVYGDDWQMVTNYPIVRLTSGTNVYYARTYNWNSTGVMRGSAPDTTQFSLPAGLPEGTYSLQVVTNGNPSAPVPFSTCTITKVETVTENPNSVSVYPNPASKQATVVFNSSQGGQYHIKLLNILGQVAIAETHDAVVGANTSQLQLSGVTKGIYTLLVQDGTGVYNTKLVVE